MQTKRQSEKSVHEPIKGWTHKQTEWLNDIYTLNLTSILKKH